MLTGDFNRRLCYAVSVPSILIFSARIISGSGRGRTIGSPTINLDLADVPANLEKGIFACKATLNGVQLPAALFYGPRPVFDDTPACEIYLIETVPAIIPDSLTVEVIEYIREVRNFDTVQELQQQIAIDVRQARAMLGTYDATQTQNTDS